MSGYLGFPKVKAALKLAINQYLYLTGSSSFPACVGF